MKKVKTVGLARSILLVACVLMTAAALLYGAPPASSTSGWETEKAVVKGRRKVIHPIPAAAYNLTGKKQWTLISGCYGGTFHACYWNGSRWIWDQTRAKGLKDVGPSTGNEYSMPATAFNLRGDGKWVLIARCYAGDWFGYYWDGAKWVEDASLIAGLVKKAGNFSSLTLIDNLTGDGKWTLITVHRTGRFDVNFVGYYWNGTRWTKDNKRVAGLPNIKQFEARLAAGFNLTGDGKWTLIATPKHHGAIFRGFYWNGTRWVEDPSRVKGLSVYKGIATNMAPVLIKDLRGDGKWALISGIWITGNCPWYVGFAYDTVTPKEIRPPENVISYNPRATTVHVKGTCNRTWNHRVKYSTNRDLNNAKWSEWREDAGKFDIKLKYLQPNTTYYYQVHTYVPWDNSCYATSAVKSFTTIPAKTPIQVNPGESIQDALDTLPLEGGTVELASGTWNVAETISIDKSNVTLQGKGLEKTHLIAGTKGISTILAHLGKTPQTTLSNVTVRDLHVRPVVEAKPSTSGESKAAIKYSNVEKSLIQGVSAEKARDHGVQLKYCRNVTVRDSTIQGVALRYAWHCLITNCTVEKKGIDTNWARIIKGLPIQCLYNTIENCEIRNCPWVGIEFYGAPFHTVRGCTIHDCGFSIWVHHAGKGAVLENNRIYNAQKYPGILVSGLRGGTKGSGTYNITIRNNIIYNSSATHGIHVRNLATPRKLPDYNARIVSNTVYGNGKDGILVENSRDVEIKNNIAAKNNGYGIHISKSVGETHISYNNTWANKEGNCLGEVGIGNMGKDPLFADPEAKDFHLKSNSGRWDAKAKKWVKDDVQSPCIDAGDPKAEFSKETASNGGRINMGAYGNTKEASKSP